MREVFIFLSTTILFVVAKEHTISTNLGQIKGLVIENNKQKVYKFFKIPYAKPPIRSLRFRKPEPYGPWNGVLDGTKPPSACMQKAETAIERNSKPSEDCLYLNIYIPGDVSMTNSKSVMVWIHGGGFRTGSGFSYDGSALATTGDVIVVTINYRLNIFGFISSGNSDLPGNYGLWDQRLAIEWVKNNIRDFGGNPSSITIFGESAGSFSVGFQIISPKNVGLFQRAILQSGSPLSRMATIESGNLDLFARIVDCHGNNTDSFIQCLQQKPALDLMNVFTNASMNHNAITPIIGGIVDGDLIPAQPGNLLQDKTSQSYQLFRSLDIIVGTVSVEGSLFLSDFLQYGMNMNISKGLTTTLLCDVLSPVFSRDIFNNISTVSEAICNRYKVINGNTAMMAEQGRQILNMYGDLNFNSPAVKLLQIHSEDNLQNKAYQFLLSHYLFQIAPIPKWVQGAIHGSINTYLFGFKQIAASNSLSIEEYNLSEIMIKYWTNFAKTGNPNGNSPVDPDWKVYSTSRGEYIHLDTSIQTKTYLYDGRVGFWNSDIPDIMNPLVTSKSGKIRGVAMQNSYNAVTEFRGIPYARPPIGNLRFARPRPVLPWTGIYDALLSPVSCIQKENPMLSQALPNKNYSEDCLYLNIYIPGRVSNLNRKSVMIFIHGGSYQHGQGSFYDGSFLAAKGDVIVVTINYRLSVFGFLSSDDSVLKGNYGLWDQKMAIEWIKDNIESFGGNASSITLFGESAGSFSVSLQAISPLNKKLFQRVITQSGTPLIEMAVSKSPPNLVLLYSDLLNCPNTSTADMVQCLRGKSADELQNVFDEMVTEYYKLNSFHPAFYTIVLKPTVDGELIPDEPFKLLGDSTSASYTFFRSLDLIAGTTNVEGSLLLETLSTLNINVSNGISTNVLCDLLAQTFASGNKYSLKLSSQKICNQYTVNDGNTLKLIEQGKQILNMFGDNFFVAPAIELLNIHSNQNEDRNSFQYLFSKSLPRQLELIPVPNWFEGASHGAELFYMFSGYQNSAEVFGTKWTQEEKRFVEALYVYWSNFAKTGNPNAKDLPNWQRFTTKEKEYQQFGSDNSIQRKKMLWQNRMKFWFDLKGINYVMKEATIGIASKPQPLFGLCLTLLVAVWLY